ncbi:hypothetical protein TKK_0009961 [Trichogramma kaykai]
MTGTGTDGYSDENENEANDIINVSMLGKLNMYTDEVIAYVSGAVVKSVQHIFEQAPLLDHRNQLIMIVLRPHFSLRLHHEAAKLSEVKDCVRTKLQRIIVFKNQ